MKYRSVVATGRGGPEMLQVVENELRPPAAGKAQIRILATPVCQDDVAVRRGSRPFLAKTPFVPGYSVLGVAEAIGEGVDRVAVGDRVAALTNFGGYAEYIECDADQLIHVPEHLDPAEAVILILNYLVPMQLLHNFVQVQPGDKILIIGASGGVGTAFLDLGRLANLTMYGIASGSKRAIVEKFGATPIDYRSQDFVEVLREVEPAGIDYVFNGMGHEYVGRSLKVLCRGGTFVHYGGPQSFSGFVLLVLKFGWYSLLPNGKRIKGYGTHTGDLSQFEDDWNQLFHLLGENKIKPVIEERYPLLEAARANERLESGQVVGNLVLQRPELL